MESNPQEKQILKPGTYVRIKGLQSKPQYNGKYGFVEEKVLERYSIITSKSQNKLNVLPQNLDII